MLILVAENCFGVRNSDAVCSGQPSSTRTTHVCAHHIANVHKSAGDRGPSYLHASDEHETGAELMTFLTDLMYCDLSLLSRILCAIGARPTTTPNLTTIPDRNTYTKSNRLYHSAGNGACAASFLSQHLSPRRVDLGDTSRKCVQL